MKKGDTASNIIMWISLFAVVIIVSTWYAGTVRPLSAESELIDFDLKQIFVYADRACASIFYNSSYVPRTNEGEIVFNESNVCMSSGSISNCIGLPCNVSSILEADLARIILLNFVFNRTDNNNLTVSVVNFS